MPELDGGARRQPKLALPGIVEIVRGALGIRGGSLVIYRRKTLIELKTDKLGAGLTLYEEGGHHSWQIGDADDHHCHLDVGACTSVVFGAEPVSCQGGRLNYTIWFLVDEDCGNPDRPEAYFSVTLDRPYTAEGAARRELVEQMFRLYQRFEGETGVSAEPTFLRALSDPDLMTTAA